MKRVYLDHHAATPMHPHALEVLQAALLQTFGNSSSQHADGRASKALIEDARAKLASAIRAKPADIVFTSSGTEACNLAISGFLQAHLEGSGTSEGKKLRVAASAVEHPAILETLAMWESRGLIEVIVPPVPTLLHPQRFSEWLGQASIQLVLQQRINHETGLLFPIEGMAKECESRSIPVLVDGTQALGKVCVDLDTLPIAALAMSSSKIGGPSGVGALWVRRGVHIDPLVLGGGQERGRRAGSPSAALIAGFGAAAERLEERLMDQERIGQLRDRWEEQLVLWGASATLDGEPRAKTVSHTALPGWSGTMLVAAFDLEGVSLSSGAACSSGVDAPSKGILALRPAEPWRARSSLRASFGPESNEEDLQRALQAADKIRQRRPA